MLNPIDFIQEQKTMDIHSDAQKGFSWNPP